MKQIIDNSGKILAIVLKNEIDFKEVKIFLLKMKQKCNLYFNLPKDTVKSTHSHYTGKNHPKHIRSNNCY